MYIQLNKTEQNNFTGYKTKARMIAKKQIAFWNLKNNYSLTNLNHYNKVNKDYKNYSSRFNIIKKIKNSIKNNKGIYLSGYLPDKLSNYLNNLFINIDDKKIFMPEIRKIQHTELDVEKRKEVTNLLNEKLEPLQENFKKLIVDRNTYAKKLGFKNYYEYFLDKLKIDYNEVQNYIDEIKNNKNYKSNLQKRDEILSEKFNISIEYLKDYHTSISLMALLDLNKYISEENYFDITKKFYKNMGFDIDKYIKSKNIKLDLYPRKNKDNCGGMCIPISTKQVRVLANLNNDINNLDILFHEMGHAVHSLNISKKLPFKFIPDSLITESVAIMMESLLYKENVLLDYLSKDLLEKVKEYNKISETNIISRMMSLVEFEKQAYENPNQDFSKLWNNIKAQNNFTKESDEEDFTFITNNFIKKPLIFIDYFKGLLIKEQFYKKLKEKVGGNITESTKTAEFLIKNLFRYGSFFKPETLIRIFSDEKLNPKYFLDYIK